MTSEDLLNIGAFALATGLTIPALRHYDEVGLLKPAAVDPDTGYRRYASVLARLYRDDAFEVWARPELGLPPVDRTGAVVPSPFP